MINPRLVRESAAVCLSPLSSIRDQELIDAVNERRISILFTGLGFSELISPQFQSSFESLNPHSPMTLI